MKNVVLKVETKVEVTQEDIDSIVAGALEGGITYWCDEAKVAGDYLGEYASDQISRGGALLLHDSEENEWRVLTKQSLLNGLKMYIENPHPYEIVQDEGDRKVIDGSMVDAEVCDMIIQYAVFKEQVYA